MARERITAEERKAGRRPSAAYRTHRAASDVCGVGLGFSDRSHSYHHNQKTDEGLACPILCKSKIEARVTHHWEMVSCKSCLGKKPKAEV